jgi:hypothetical protein
MCKIFEGTCATQVEAWVIIFVFFCAGSALIVINNIAQISGALENPHVGMMLIAIGIANALGGPPYPIYLFSMSRHVTYSIPLSASGLWSL